MQERKRRFLWLMPICLMLWLTLCLLLPVKTLAAPANEVWVNGVNVSDPNTVMPAGVEYDATTATLKLTNARLTQTHSGSSHDAVIHAQGDLIIVLEGENMIEASGGQYFLDGIYCEGSVTFEGTGSLSVQVDGTASEQYGLALGYPGSNRNTEVRVRGGNITLIGKTAGLYADASYGGSSPLEKKLIIEGGSLTLIGQSRASSIPPEFDEDSLIITASYDTSGSPAAEYNPFEPGMCYYTYLKIEELVYDEYGFGPGLHYQPAVKAADGVYEISNAGQLFWFAKETTGTGGSALNARLTKDIIIPNGRVFSPIGGSQGGNSYSGTFDGQGYSITGMTISNSMNIYTGFVGKLSQGGIIRNVHFKDVSVNATVSDVGAICSTNYGTIENCSVESGNVSGLLSVGGICGANNGTILLCTNMADVSASMNSAGGICGKNTGTVENCLNTGNAGAQWYIGGICGENASGAMVHSCLNLGAVTATLPGYESTAGGLVGARFALPVNSYYAAAAEGFDGARTREQLLSGEVTWLLNEEQATGVWGQMLDGASMPELEGKAVYYGYLSCDGSTGYANESLPQDVPAHHYIYQHDADEHRQVCSVCGAEGAHEAHMLSWVTDENGHNELCSVCGYSTAHEAHTLSWVTNESGHNELCSVCGYSTAREAHTLSWVTDENGHNELCSVCGYSTAHEAHTLSWVTDESGHSAKCVICGYSTGYEAHTYNSDKVCVDCGYAQIVSIPKAGDSTRSGVWMVFALVSGLIAVVMLKRKHTA